MKELAKEVLTILIMALAPALAAAVGGIITACGKALIDWIKAKTAKDKTAEKWLNTTESLKLAILAVEDAINDSMQSVVDDLKGTELWDDSAKIRAKNHAVEAAQKLMGNEVKKFLEDFCGDASKWIESQVENRLEAVKSDRAKLRNDANPAMPAVVGGFNQ